MKYCAFLGCLCGLGLSLSACQKSESESIPLPERKIAFVRGYDEAFALASQSIGLLDGAPTTRGAAPRTIESGECVVVPGTRAAGGATDTLLYVFNFADNAGFSIISADASKEPLIAVTEKGHYVYGEATGVEPFDAYMAQAVTPGEKPVGPEIPLIPDPRPRVYTIEYNTDESVGPLLQTKWGQAEPYGMFCSNNISGCTATAMAQILAYYRMPSSIILTENIGPYKAADCIELNWTEILRHYGFVQCNGLDNDAHVQIGILMREIGKRVGMDYDIMSGTDNTMVNKTFRSFGYAVSDTLRYCSTDEIFGSLKAKRPALVCGLVKNSHYGHTWVADGYIDYKCGVEYYEWTPFDPGIVDDLKPVQEGMYLVTHSTVVERHLLHFNWGWDGNCDGYFSLGGYDPNHADQYDDLIWWSNTHDHSYEDQVKFLLNVHK